MTEPATRSTNTTTGWSYFIVTVDIKKNIEDMTEPSARPTNATTFVDNFVQQLASTSNKS